MTIREFKEELVDREGFKVGDVVIARFTSGGYFKQFRGKVIGRTLNYWKVEALEQVWEGDQPGRVFQIYSAASPRYSMNNRLVAEKTPPFSVLDADRQTSLMINDYDTASTFAEKMAEKNPGEWTVTNDRGHVLSTVIVLARKRADG